MKKKVTISIIVALLIIIGAITITIINSIKEKEKSIKIEQEIKSFKLNSENKYIITTDLKLYTLAYDGGSYTSNYYQIDLDNNVVEKIEEIYEANLGGKPKTTTKRIYLKKISDYTKEELSDKLKNAVEYADDNENNENKENYYTIKSQKYEKKIYAINTLKDYLTVIDKINNNNIKLDNEYKIEHTEYDNCCGGYTTQYQINFNDNKIIKTQTNLKGQTHTVTKEIIYDKTFDEQTKNKLQNLIKEIIIKEDINDNHYDLGYIIESQNISKQIRNKTTINKINNYLYEIEKENHLILTIKSSMLKCPSPTLYVYDNGTYDYYYTYTKTEDNKKPTPKTGTYKYNINKIINNLDEKNNDKYPGFEVKYNNKEYELDENNKYLNEFFKSININIHTCLELEN